MLGLGALGLLWPLAALTGMSAALGPLRTVLLLGGVTAAVWIGFVGLSNAPRPVLTLALAGTGYGIVLVVQSLTLGSRLDAFGGGLVVVAAVFEIGRSALLGMLAGLVARGVQLAVGSRR